jgi:hypothetical protein
VLTCVVGFNTRKMSKGVNRVFTAQNLRDSVNSRGSLAGVLADERVIDQALSKIAPVQKSRAGTKRECVAGT